ncbi:MAG: phage holin family protein [Candidatus Gottesmanbacteria bacterium]
MKIIANWIVSALAILITAYLLPGIHIAGFLSALVVALVLGIINAVLKPILIILTLPITILTLGLFTLVINALLVLLASNIVNGFTVDNFWWAFLFSLILSVVNSILHRLVH